MATDEQTIANRKNAQSSTGPRTEAGKATSSRNALTLGLFTKRDYVRRKEETEYNELCARCLTELNPEGILEETLVTEIISATWLLRRCATVERELVRTEKLDPMQDAWSRETQASVNRARSHASLLLRRSILELRRLQSDRFLAKKLLSDETGLPALASPKQVVTLINQHRRAELKEAQPHQQKSASNCNSESALSDPHNNRAQTPRNGRCPCGSGEKFKRCCLRGGQDAPPVLGPRGSTDQSPIDEAA